MTAPRHSAPYAFKSRYYVEHTDWDADIKVDYDSNRNPLRMRVVRKAALWLERRRIFVDRLAVSRTAKGVHLRAWTSTPLGPYTVLRVQALLGDDPMRQCFNAARVRRKEPNWNVLFNEKWRNGRLLYREALSPELTERVARILKKEQQQS